MCQTLVTHLICCGRTVTGPILQCTTASASQPRGPPHDDGRTVLCASGGFLYTTQDACCQRCFAIIFAGFLRNMCWPCHGVMMGLMGEALAGHIERIAQPNNTAETPEDGFNWETTEEDTNYDGSSEEHW